jgi:outer membrane protein assembly factor BamB
MKLYLKKTILSLLFLLLASCGFLDRGPNSTVRHTFRESPFATVTWSKDNIVTSIDDNSATLISAPNRIIALGIQPKTLYAFDSITGNIVWKQNRVFPNIIATHDSVLYTGDLNTITAYDAASGKSMWKAHTPYAGQFIAITFLNDKIFLYSSNTSFFILDSSGQVLKSTDPYYFPMPYIVGDDITYAGNDNGIIAFETQTGNTIWQANIEGSLYAGPYFLEDSIYLRTGTSVIPGSVYAMDKSNGRILWIKDANAISNICSLGKNLYFLTLDGYLMVLDQQTGTEVAKLEFSPRPFILPTAEWRLGGYYVASDPANNIIAVSLGDSYQLFALKISNP